MSPLPRLMEPFPCGGSPCSPARAVMASDAPQDAPDLTPRRRRRTGSTSGPTRGARAGNLPDRVRPGHRRMTSQARRRGGQPVVPRHPPETAFLYAVGEVDDFKGKKAGGSPPSPSTARAAPDAPKRALVERGRPLPPLGGSAGKNVLVANYGGGSVAVLPIGEDGRLARPGVHPAAGSGAHPKPQGGPHAHSINLDAANGSRSSPTWASTRCWSTGSTPTRARSPRTNRPAARSSRARARATSPSTRREQRLRHRRDACDRRPR